MHILFVHKNFPAQFGHIARAIAARKDFECTFVSELPEANVDGIRRISYRTAGGARSTTHYCSRTFENAMTCDCTILASDTAPVGEFIEDGKSGLLPSFYDVDQLTVQALQVMDDPAAHRCLGNAFVELIREKYSLTATLPKLVELVENVCSRPRNPMPSLTAVAV
jgi:hypothetical protein